VNRPRKPRCGKPVQAYYLNRTRAYEDESPVCGLTEGHKSNCVSTEAVEHANRVRAANRRISRGG